MKIHTKIFFAGLICFQFVSAHAQFGGGQSAPNIGGSTAKLFGNNSNFSAAIEIQTKAGAAGDAVTMPGKIFFSDGKSRFEMDMAKMKMDKMPPGAAQQMKAMGMDKMISVSRPDKKISYLIYPGLQGYVEMPLQDSQTGESTNDFKVEMTQLGKETVNGHPTIKNKAVVTDDKGNKHEAIVWNATDLKNFPVKIEQDPNGTAMIMTFDNVKLSRPDPKLFEAPTEFKKHASLQAMMQEAMMKHFGGGQGIPVPNQ